MTLLPRQKALLAAVIERYVENAEPVGSNALANDARFRAQFGGISTATIRNELAELEAAGLLSHPHTSAGRVPTDAGYRFYVNQLLQPRPLRSSERAQIRSRIPTPPNSIEDALREATAALALLTGYPSVATLPNANRDTMRQIQINPLPPQRLILIMVTASGRIEHRLFDVEQDVPVARLNTVVNFLNEQFSGRALSELRALSFEDVSAGLHDEVTLQLARRAWEQLRASVADLGDERIVVQGVITLLDEPEFSDIAHARAAMRLFQDPIALGDLVHANMSFVEHTMDGALEPSRGGQSTFRGGRARPSTGAIVIGREQLENSQAQSGGIENSAVERFSFVGISYSAGGEVICT
ncbi:MAG: heat-inducible transcriptional repressor, partial [Abditibacteriota bacterium]|nr:heat-inducible transcriptional repressor [Abditibacteriota bacterium]